MFRLLTLAAAALLIAACATSTPYGPAENGKGYGFSDQRIESNRYRITFRGNSVTSRETVENALLYRAAELTVEARLGRCAATNVDPSTGQRDLTVPRDLLRGFGHEDCGIYARVTLGGQVVPGDPVTVLD